VLRRLATTEVKAYLVYPIIIHDNKVVASYDKSALVTAGKLKSTDGVYGIRFAHNTDAIVTGLKITKP